MKVDGWRLVLAGCFIILAVSLWLDPILFGGTWELYVVGGVLEVGCFLGGFAVGRLDR